MTLPKPIMKKERCECELFIEKYFGIHNGANERTPITTDYGDLVNLLAMFRDELKAKPTPFH